MYKAYKPSDSECFTPSSEPLLVRRRIESTSHSFPVNSNLQFVASKRKPCVFWDLLIALFIYFLREELLASRLTSKLEDLPLSAVLVILFSTFATILNRCGPSRHHK
jgi:hypothetical protein